MIASSPTDLQPVFEAIVGSAAQLCEATFVGLHRFDGQVVTFDAQHGMTEPEVEESRSRFPRLPGRDIAVILGVIASSPTDVQPVLNVVAENAARLCEATDAVITRIDGETFKQVAQFGAIPVVGPSRITRDLPIGRAIVDRKTIHVDDLRRKSKPSTRSQSAPASVWHSHHTGHAFAAGRCSHRND